MWIILNLTLMTLLEARLYLNWISWLNLIPHHKDHTQGCCHTLKQNQCMTFVFSWSFILISREMHPLDNLNRNNTHAIWSAVYFLNLIWYECSDYLISKVCKLKYECRENYWLQKEELNIAELWTTRTALKYFAKLEVWCLKWRVFADV